METGTTVFTKKKNKKYENENNKTSKTKQNKLDFHVHLQRFPRPTTDKNILTGFSHEAQPSSNKRVKKFKNGLSRIF